MPTLLALLLVVAVVALPELTRRRHPGPASRVPGLSTDEIARIRRDHPGPRALRW